MDTSGGNPHEDAHALGADAPGGTNVPQEEARASEADLADQDPDAGAAEVVSVLSADGEAQDAP